MTRPMPPAAPQIAQERGNVAEAPIVLTLPLPPNQNREQGHWAGRHRRKMLYFRDCDLLVLTCRLPPPPAKPLTSALVSAVMVMPAAMDPDNAKYRASKWPMDYLKSRGYIAQDTAKVVTWTGDPEQRISRKQPASLTITLMPITTGPR